VRRRVAGALAVALAAVGAIANATAAADAGQFKTYTYSNAKGTLTYKVYTPPVAGPKPTSLVVVLPGAGETSDVAATHSRFNIVARQLHFVVAYPEQNLDYNSSREWDWATASKEGRNNREASLIAGITQTVTDRNHLDPQRVFVMGISAGAGMASAMAVSFPDLYRGLGIEAGCPFDNAGCAGGSVTADQSAAAAVKAMGSYARRMPVFNEYGSIDPIAVGVSSNQVVPSWLTIDDTLDNGTDDGSVSRTASADNVVTPPPPAKPYRVTEFRDSRGCELAQDWLVFGEFHAWSGGAQTDPTDTSADPLAPDASTAMYRFFTDPHTLGGSAECAD
jgi:poly(hydroxyalkanoate) depolymerase family esterase